MKIKRNLDLRCETRECETREGEKSRPLHLQSYTHWFLKVTKGPQGPYVSKPGPVLPQVGE